MMVLRAFSLDICHSHKSFGSRAYAAVASIDAAPPGTCSQRGSTEMSKRSLTSPNGIPMQATTARVRTSGIYGIRSPKTAIQMPTSQSPAIHCSTRMVGGS